MALNAAGALAASLMLVGCSLTYPPVLMQALKAQFAQQGYKCVPLGWVPVPANGTYLQGFSAELDDTDWWLPSLWTGSVSTQASKRADVRVTREVLDELVRAGMLERKHVRLDDHYNLTVRAMPYYFDQNDLGNNPEHFPYLCYSMIIPQRVIWNHPIHLEQVAGESGKLQVFRAAFQWIPGPAASWADDAMLQSRSVVFASTQSPITVKFVNRDGTWEIDSVHTFPSSFPRVADASVWSP